jgi:hypothetical protein
VLDPVRNLKVYLTALFSLLALCVALTAAATYVSLRAHYLRQQASELQRSQDFIQLRNELTKPFQLSRWMSRDAFLMDWLGKGEREPGRVLSYLKEISANWQVSAFVASNLTRKYYFSDGTTKVLDQETPDGGWFFQLLERRVESLADVGYDNGDKSRPFLYIDIRMPDLHGTTSAYVGAAVELQHFQSLLSTYRQQHGDELHFVNQDRMVVLSTTPGSVNTPADQYDWYQLTSTLPHAHESGQEKGVSFLDRQGRHFSISREWLEDLGWHVYRERDLQATQSSVARMVLRTLGLITLLIGLTLTAMTWLLQRFRRDLQRAFAQIRTLKGILPICCSCKKIRDDNGYWQQLELYLSQHSEADLSHGICPDCARKLYPELSHKHLE